MEGYNAASLSLKKTSVKKMKNSQVLKAPKTNKQAYHAHARESERSKNYGLFSDSMEETPLFNLQREKEKQKPTGIRHRRSLRLQSQNPEFEMGLPRPGRRSNNDQNKDSFGRVHNKKSRTRKDYASADPSRYQEKQHISDTLSNSVYILSSASSSSSSLASPKHSRTEALPAVHTFKNASKQGNFMHSQRPVPERTTPQSQREHRLSRRNSIAKLRKHVKASNMHAINLSRKALPHSGKTSRHRKPPVSSELVCYPASTGVRVGVTPAKTEESSPSKPPSLKRSHDTTSFPGYRLYPQDTTSHNLMAEDSGIITSETAYTSSSAASQSQAGQSHAGIPRIHPPSLGPSKMGGVPRAHIASLPTTSIITSTGENLAHTTTGVGLAPAKTLPPSSSFLAAVSTVQPSSNFSPRNAAVNYQGIGGVDTRLSSVTAKAGVPHMMYHATRLGHQGNTAFKTVSATTAATGNYNAFPLSSAAFDNTPRLPPRVLEEGQAVLLQSQSLHPARSVDVEGIDRQQLQFNKRDRAAFPEYNPMVLPPFHTPPRVREAASVDVFTTKGDVTSSKAIIRKEDDAAFGGMQRATEGTYPSGVITSSIPGRKDTALVTEKLQDLSLTPMNKRQCRVSMNRVMQKELSPYVIEEWEDEGAENMIGNHSNPELVMPAGSWNPSAPDSKAFFDRRRGLQSAFKPSFITLRQRAKSLPLHVGFVLPSDRPLMKDSQASASPAYFVSPQKMNENQPFVEEPPSEAHRNASLPPSSLLHLHSSRTSSTKEGSSGQEKTRFDAVTTQKGTPAEPVYTRAAGYPSGSILHTLPSSFYTSTARDDPTFAASFPSVNLALTPTNSSLSVHSSKPSCSYATGYSSTSMYTSTRGHVSTPTTHTSFPTSSAIPPSSLPSAPVSMPGSAFPSTFPYALSAATVCTPAHVSMTVHATHVSTPAPVSTPAHLPVAAHTTNVSTPAHTTNVSAAAHISNVSTQTQPFKTTSSTPPLLRKQRHSFVLPIASTGIEPALKTHAPPENLRRISPFHSPLPAHTPSVSSPFKFLHSTPTTTLPLHRAIPLGRDKELSNSTTASPTKPFAASTLSFSPIGVEDKAKGRGFVTVDVVKGYLSKYKMPHPPEGFCPPTKFSNVDETLPLRLGYSMTILKLGEKYKDFLKTKLADMPEVGKFNSKRKAMLLRLVSAVFNQTGAIFQKKVREKEIQRGLHPQKKSQQLSTPLKFEETLDVALHTALNEKFANHFDRTVKLLKEWEAVESILQRFNITWDAFLSLPQESSMDTPPRLAVEEEWVENEAPPVSPSSSPSTALQLSFPVAAEHAAVSLFLKKIVDNVCITPAFAEAFKAQQELCGIQNRNKMQTVQKEVLEGMKNCCILLDGLCWFRQKIANFSKLLANRVIFNVDEKKHLLLMQKIAREKRLISIPANVQPPPPPWLQTITSKLPDSSEFKTFLEQSFFTSSKRHSLTSLLDSAKKSQDASENENIPQNVVEIGGESTGNVKLVPPSIEKGKGTTKESSRNSLSSSSLNIITLDGKDTFRGRADGKDMLHKLHLLRMKRNTENSLEPTEWNADSMLWSNRATQADDLLGSLRDVNEVELDDFVVPLPTLRKSRNS